MTKLEMLGEICKRFGLENENTIYFANLMDTVSYNDLRNEYNAIMAKSFWDEVEEL